MSDTWLRATASDLGRGIGAGEIDPVALTEAYLDAADAHPHQHQIYARMTRDRALAEAKAAKARAKAGNRRGLLDGVPISWKDLVDTAGVETEAGSAFLKGRVPERDAVCLEEATRAGTVCLGKTHMTELAFSGLGLNPITQTPPCVNDTAAVPGGSSSGAATSVAFGLAAAGIGSDTGGSVRIPAAWNDLVGLKTTSGLISLQGVVPLCSSFDTIGPLTRSVEDAAEVLSAMTGAPVPDLAGATLTGRRFAICKSVAMDDLSDPSARSFQDAVARLVKAGATVEEIDIPEVAEAHPLSACLFTSEAYAQWQTEIEATPELMYSEVLERFRGGLNFSSVEYVTAQKRMMQLRQAYLVRVAGYDGVLVPTSPILPPNLQKLQQDHDYFVTQNLLALRNTRIGNLMGLCALTLPTDVKSCGLIVMGKPFEEARLLRLGAAMEPVVRGD